jgi:hypothetical protein
MVSLRDIYISGAKINVMYQPGGGEESILCRTLITTLYMKFITQTECMHDLTESDTT